MRVPRQWQAAPGVDNLGAEHDRAFHPYLQRTFVAELRHDL
jgi:iron complex outermembrane receptor protein